MARQTVLLLLLASPLAAQGTAPAPPADTVVHHQPGPFNYFFRSLFLPGWGQASLDRKLTAGLFIAFEGVSLGMALKADAEVHYPLAVGDTALVRTKRAERQDWIVLLVANHLFAALEAYVSAHLRDFPGDLKLRAFGGPRPGLGFTIHVP
jgi:hypothetical protein